MTPAAYLSNWMSTVLMALAVLALARLAPGPETNLENQAESREVAPRAKEK